MREPDESYTNISFRQELIELTKIVVINNAFFILLQELFYYRRALCVS